jgi:hypothetical protein
MFRLSAESVQLMRGWVWTDGLNEDEVRAALSYHARIVAATLLQPEVKIRRQPSKLKR